MNCPYCQTPLQPNTLQDKNNEQVECFECFNCGGHWLPPLLANNITSTQAADLDAVIPKDSSAPTQARCPICQTRLSLISHDSVPQGVKIWTCPQGHGNFFPYKQLLQFKTAQEAKINYHTVWGIPIKSLVSVMLPVIAVIAVAAGLPLIIQKLQTGQETRTKASEIHSKPIVTRISQNSTLVSFTSKAPSTSTLMLFQNGVFVSKHIVAESATTSHKLTLPIDADETHTFTISLTDPITGTITSSQEYPLTPPNEP